MKFGLLTKIIILSILLVMLGAGVAGFGIYKTKEVVEDYKHVANINLPNAAAMSDMMANQKDIYVLLINWEKNGKKEELKEEILNKIAKYEKGDSWYQSIPFVPGESEIYEKISEVWKRYKEEVNNFFEGNGDSDKLLSLYNEYELKMSKLLAFQGSEGVRWSKHADEVASMTLKLQLIMILVLILISYFLSYFLGRAIVQSIQNTIKALKDTSEQVASASTKIAATSERLSETTTEQAASLQETSSSIEEITQMIANNTENSKNTSSTASNGLNSANQGMVVVGDMIAAISEISRSNLEIAQQVNETNNDINQIVHIISEIGNKTKVINDIVFQTKLLSFNASVEAARAGEQGKGFAVVAEEIGNLATMSGMAASEITQMLDQSMKTVESIVHNSKEKIERIVNLSKEKVSTGNEVAKKCEDAFNRIHKDISDISKMINEIANASVEQSQGVSEINKAISQLDHLTHENASKSQESSQAASSLSEQTKMLDQAIIELSKIIDGNR